ncbi:MAG: DNA-binding protein [Candidatus Woesearchaeota archaeon]|nr:DNA-binding protein [Candidatus Woesearchaeota archaeon]
MDELEKLRKKKLEQIQNQYSDQAVQQQQVQQQAQQQIQALENMVKPRLTKKAIERYGNLKTGHPRKAVQLLMVLAQTGQSKINDKQLKAILKKMDSKKEINITHR